MKRKQLEQGGDPPKRVKDGKVYTGKRGAPAKYVPPVPSVASHFAKVPKPAEADAAAAPPEGDVEMAQQLAAEEVKIAAGTPGAGAAAAVAPMPAQPIPAAPAEVIVMDEGDDDAPAPVDGKEAKAAAEAHAGEHKGRKFNENWARNRPWLTLVDDGKLYGMACSVCDDLKTSWSRIAPCSTLTKQAVEKHEKSQVHLSRTTAATFALSTEGFIEAAKVAMGEDQALLDAWVACFRILYFQAKKQVTRVSSGYSSHAG